MNALPILSTWLLGQVEYSDGLAAQEVLVSLRQNQKIADTLLILEHPPTITLGRGAKRDNILASKSLLELSGISVYETGRGGDVTFHGPGQIIAYPILQLDGDNRDVKKYMRKLEEVVIHTLSDFDIKSDRIDGLTGVWIGKNKIAAQGVRIAKWITSHGLALNVNINLNYFELIIPCGISDKGVTSISKELKNEVQISQIKEKIIYHFGEIFKRNILLQNIQSKSIQIVIVYKGVTQIEFLLFHNTQENSLELITDSFLIENEIPSANTVKKILYEQIGLQDNTIDLYYINDFLLNSQTNDSQKYLPIFNRQYSFLTTVKNKNIRPSLNNHKIRWFNKNELTQYLVSTKILYAIDLAEKILRT